MDAETRELLNAIVGELDRVEQKIYGKIDEVNDKLETLQKDVNLLKARNDYLDLYTLYNQVRKKNERIRKKSIIIFA